LTDEDKQGLTLHATSPNNKFWRGGFVSSGGVIIVGNLDLDFDTSSLCPAKANKFAFALGLFVSLHHYDRCQRQN